MTIASAVQEQFWLFDQLHAASPACHVVSAFELSGELDVGALERALSAIVNKHALLRCGLALDGTRLALTAPISGAATLERRSLTGLADARAQALAHVNAFVRRPFSLAEPPLVRALLVERAPAQHVLALVLHHSVCDLRSKELLAAELCQHYAAERAGTPLPSTPPERGYLDYCDRQAQWRDSEAARSMAEHWREQLAGYSGTLALPTDHPRPPRLSGRGSSVTFELSPELALGINDLGRELSAPPFLILLSAYFALLHRYAGQRDVIVGVPLTNRRSAAYKDTFGCMMHNVPIGLELDGAHSFRTVLLALRKQLLAGHRHQELPLQDIIAASGTARDASRPPLFQVGFTFEPLLELELAGLKVESMPVETQGALLELMLVLRKLDERVAGVIEYAAELYERPTVEALCANFLTLLAHAVSCPDLPIERLELVATSERELLLTRGGRAEQVMYGHGIHNEFAQQAERTPQRVAVVCGDERVSYRALNERADRLAEQLRSHSAPSDAPIGLYLGRSVGMLVGMLAILKAGFAYLPLDPSFPSERIRFMLEDCQVALIVSEEPFARKLPPHAAKLVLIEPIEQAR